MKRAVLYARVSGDDRNNATSSIEGQLKDGRAYAKEHGYTIVGEFTEDATRHTSGADMLPELEKVLRLAAQKFFDVLVVRELDRLARNRFKQMSVENELERFGVRVEYVVGRYEDTPDGRLLKGIMAEFAEFEREKIKQRMTRGIERAVKAGNVQIGGSYAPYGYDLVKENGRRVLVVNEVEAAVVRQIFDLYGNQGYTLHGLGDWLDGRGVPKPAKGNNHRKCNTKKQWSVGTLSGILNNETYAGRWYYRKTRTWKDATGKVQQTPRPRSEWLLVNVPAIVSDALFEKVQQRREKNKRQHQKRQKHFYLLSGIVECGRCGNGFSGVMKVDGARRWGYYKCNAHHLPKRYGFKCDNLQFKKDELETAVWGWVRELLISPEKLAESLATYQEQQQAAHQPLVGMIDANEQKLESVKAEKERLIDAYTAGVLSLDEIATKKARVDKEIADLNGALAALRSELEPKLLTAGQIVTIQEWAAKIRVGAEVALEAEPEGAQEVLRLLQTRVILGFNHKGKWAKVSCVLGQDELSTNNTTGLPSVNGCIVETVLVMA